MRWDRLLTVTVGVLAALGLVAAVAFVAAAGGSSGTAVATTGTTGTTGPADSGVLVSGVGTASGTPDVLRATLGVEVTAAGVDAALDGANEAAERLYATLRDQGVSDEDLQTTSVQVHPRYDDRGRAVTGYVVSQSVTATIRDLDGAGETLSAGVRAAGDAARLHGVTFALEDDEALLAAAREEAFADARDKADQYARITDRDLGDVVSVRETVQPVTGPLPAYDAAGAEEAARSVPLQPGSTEVNVTVDVRWLFR